SDLVQAEETASEVVPIAGSVAVRIRLKADKAGELDVAILDATGATPVEGEPKGVLGVAAAADTEAVVEVTNLMGESWLEVTFTAGRSEEHTSELQSREKLVCRLQLEKKK